MPTSSITVRTNSSEYSRYYRPQQVITAVITTVGASNGVVATAKLTRADGFGTVSTKAAAIQTNTATITWDLNTDGYDTDGIYRIRQGVYTVHVTVDDASTVGDSAQFDIMLVSVKELKDRWLRGIDLFAKNATRPRQQPRTVTGVTVDDTSVSQMRGVFNLVWDATNSTLSWGTTLQGQGTPVVVSKTTTAEYLLMNASSTAYIQVAVVGNLLPVGNVTEAIVMDYDAIEEEELRQFLLTAYGEIQGKLYVRLEPTDIDTEGIGSSQYNTTGYPPTAWVDEYVQPISYYKPEFLRNWLVIKFPFPYIRKVSRLEGYFNGSKAFTVNPAEWIVRNDVAGEVEFVPKQGALMSWQFTGLPFFAFMYTFAHIPSFWHYRLTIGLADLDSDTVGARVRDCIARYAAIDILTLAGQAAAPGLVGESTSRDGVSESRSYAQGQGGIYGTVIQQHQAYLFGPDGEGGEIKRLKQRLLGLYMVVL